MQSMTGYGRCRLICEDGREMTVEVKSGEPSFSGCILPYAPERSAFWRTTLRTGSWRRQLRTGSCGRFCELPQIHRADARTG